MKGVSRKILISIIYWGGSVLFFHPVHIFSVKWLNIDSKKAKSYQRRAIKALLSTGFGQICPISCGSTFPGSSHAMTVSEVPREMQSSPGQRPIPANEAWLSPVNAVTSHSGSKPKRSAMYLEILPKFSVEATGDPGGKLKNTVNAVMSHYGSKLKRSAMYLEIFPMFWVEETGDPGKMRNVYGLRQRWWKKWKNMINDVTPHSRSKRSVMYLEIFPKF